VLDDGGGGGEDGVGEDGDAAGLGSAKESGLGGGRNVGVYDGDAS